MAFDPSTAQLMNQTKSSFDPSTAQLINTPKPDSLPAPLAAAYVAGSNFGQGATEASQQLGGLVADILTTGYDTIYGKDNILSKGVKAFRKKGGEVTDSVTDYLQPHTPAERKAMDDYPVLGPLAKTIGYVGGSLAPQAKLMGPISNTIESGLTNVAPMIGKSPTIRGAISQATLGAGLGAASNPDNRLGGAIQGATIGGVLGAVGGAVGSRLERQGNIVKFEIDNLKAARISPSSLEGVSRITKSLKDNGADLSKQSVQREITKNIGEYILKAGPLDDLNAPAAETIANLAKTNYPKVVTKVNELKAPLVASKQTFAASNYQAAINNKELPIIAPQLKKAVPKITENSTFDQLWTRRQELDEVIQIAKARAVKNVSFKRSLPGLIQSRDALTTDLATAAESMGLKSNWTQINQVYQSQLKPFQYLRTQSGKMLSESDVDDAMKTINTLLNPKISPNYRALNRIAATVGPDGKQIVGQAMLQNTYLKSLNDKGLVEPKTYFTQLKKATTSGLEKRLWTDETRNAADGIKEILDGADESMKLGSPIQTAPGFITKFIDYATKNRAAFWALEKIGSSATPQKTVRAMLQKILTANIVLPDVSAEEQSKN